MTHGFKSLLIAALLASAGMAAHAQGAGVPATGGMAHHQRMDPARMQEMMAKHQADMKAKLKLSPSQENAWNAYMASMQPPADMAARMNPENRQKMHDEMQKLTTPERIDRMNAMKAQRDAEMAKRGESTKTFYAVLSPEQKKVFDANSMRGGRGGRHGGDGKMGMHG